LELSNRFAVLQEDLSIEDKWELFSTSVKASADTVIGRRRGTNRERWISEVEAHYIFHPSTILVRPLFTELGPKKPQKADFAMKQTNICHLSGDIIRSSHGHSTPSLKISCKSVQTFSRNLADKE